MPSSRVVLDAVAHGQLRLKDLAATLDVTPQRVRQLIELDGFPKPVRVIGRSRLWNRVDIEEWTVRATRWRASG